MISRLIAAFALAIAGAASAQAPEPAERESPSDESDLELGVEAEEAEGAAVKPPAAALPDRPVVLRIGGALTWDSNFFRSPSPREERVASAFAGVSVDKSYAQQRFRFDATETAYRYDNFPRLDFDALNYLGALDWRFGPRIGGTLTATRAQGLADYSEFRRPGERNVRTTENFSLGADAWLFGGWHVTGAFTHVRNRYSVPFPQEGSYRASGGDAGVKWVAPSTNWLALNFRSLDGRYIDRALDPVARLDDGFRRTETEALVSWRMSGKSTFDGRLAHVDYRSDHFAERDFSGIAARLRYLWDLTAKLALTATVSREIEPWTEAAASRRIDERVTLGPVWQAAARTTLRLDATQTESDFRDPLPGFAAAPRRDRQNSVNFEAEWRALHNLSLKAAAQRYRQSSTDPAFSFSGKQVMLSLSFLL